MRLKTSQCSASHVSWQRDTARSCWWAPAVQQSIAISCPPGPQQQTRRTLLQRSMDGTDRRADRRTDNIPLHRPCHIFANSGKIKYVRRNRTFLPTFSRVTDFPSAAHSAIDTGPFALFWYVVLADISPFTTWLTLIDESIHVTYQKLWDYSLMKWHRALLLIAYIALRVA